MLGASPQDATSHKRFAAKHQLDFPLLVDSDLKLAESFGAVAEKPGEFEGIILKVKRSTFVISPDGKIERAMYGVKVKGHVEDLLAGLD